MRTAIATALVALCLIGAVTWIAASRAGPVARCPDGMLPFGPRCCGEGQHLDTENRCQGTPTRCAAALRPTPEGCVSDSDPVTIPGGTLRLGPGDWEAQGIVEPHEASLPPFALDRFEVTEARYTACVTAAACAPVPMRGEQGLPVTGVTLAEASRCCAFAGGMVPSRDQLALAAAGTAGRRYPWGDTGAVCRRAAFGLLDGPCGEDASGPDLAGSRPAGASPQGVLDLAGNVAEWTSPPDPAAPTSDVVGGSWMDAGAPALRTWSVRRLPVTTRARDIGFRCAYPLR
ncbi:formylglycine-generating enzyme family protein [Chondromyces apiculatus]|uniref:Sulfatase-modifying factor enzyme-like domain-containing protein n=1 Tax=Chondromyces apiculatus DSM 436 TaxID=1192034 RepID=A0A017T4W4_9BACT|nr:SUMF1/EgtB/PvdO family nonheme iron enzyme [Chondromyces apiculatus]EYF03581.1 Hypothetical protein CAP_5372 [Chondromyces apiculatus DSM 436]